MASKSTEYYRSNKKARDRKKEYDTEYQSSRKEKQRRAARNASRKKMIAKGKVSKGQDVHHKDGNPKNKSDSNLKAESKSKNRGRK